MTTLLEAPPADAPDLRAPEERADPGHPQAAPRSHASRIGWSVVSLFVAFSGEQAWGASLSVPGAAVASIALIAGGLISLWRLWTDKAEPPAWLQLALLTGLVVGTGFDAARMWLFDPAYGTDAVAFDQYAAWLTLHGANPYTHSMQPSLSLFHVPAIYHTYRLDGSAVTALSYPVGSFLFYLPVLALGISTQAANIVDLAFWFAGMFLLWKLLPRDVRWVAGLILAAPMYLSFMIGGLTDALFVPFVLLAVYQWDRFADRADRRWTRWIGPAALGVAMSIKQTPWFLAPYLLLGLYFEAKARRVNPAKTVGAYLAVALGVFAAINGPFIAADPRDWVTGALVPFLDPTIPDGQGLINLVIFEHMGGGNLKWFTVLALGFVALSLLAFTLRYQSLKRAWVPLIALMFFLPTRSFGSYLFMLIPAALVAATTVAPAAANPFPRLSRRARPVLALGALGVLAVAGAALTAPSPMSMTVTATRSTGQLQTLDQVTVHVLNRTGETLRPHFTVNSSGHATTFWYARTDDGPYQVVLAPHQQATVILQAPNTASMPGVTAPLLVEAFTSAPQSVSVSAKYTVSTRGTRIVPDAVDAPVPVGRPITLTVQAQNQYGAAITQAGIPVTLGQTVYGQNAFYAGEASINGHPEGLSPVTVLTDAAGQAVFTVTGVQAQPEPVYFQALIQRPGEVPHGYSNQVSIQFTPAP